MRSFAEMPGWLLVIFIVMLAAMLVGLVLGMALIESKDIVNKVFGALTMIIATFISVPVFLTGLITTVPAEGSETVVNVLSILTEFVVWGSLLPILITPVFLVSFLMKQHSQVSSNSKSQMGHFVTMRERWKNPIQSLRRPRLVR